jgi:putative NIF3 family GTP cyclohydrolase 1 type 2
MIWDIRKAPKVFTNINKELLQKLRDKRISIYTLHTPLDKNSEYSTSVNLARVLGIKKIGDFCEYFGVMVGVIGTTELKTIEELYNRLSSVVDHKTKLWNYGSNEIKDQKVALIAGGGNEAESNQKIIDIGINTFVTGITLLNDYSKKAHDVAKSGNLNIIGGTHYSTEKFACMKMCEYFENLGIQTEFIEDVPILEDM